MDHDWETAQRRLIPQTRYSLSVDSLLQQENLSGASTDVEAIELTTGISRPDERTDSEDLEQPLQDRQTHSDQAETNAVQTQRVRTHGNESTESKSESLIETRKGTRSGSLFKDWTWEIISMLVAIGCLIAIFVILDKFNGQEPPNWRFSSVNLSTVIALIATILRLVLGNVLGAG